MNEICTDGRFELIAAYKQKLIERTNIETSPEEMAVIDNVLFRFWQMKWLPPLPHGRLIDADAVLQYYGISTHPTDCDGCKRKDERSCGELLVLCEAVTDAPTIIEAEDKE